VEAITEVTMETVTAETTGITRMIANTAARTGVISSGKRARSARHAPRRCRPGSVFVPDAARISDVAFSARVVAVNCLPGRDFAPAAARR
jgi:hypothetical protein